MLLTPDSWRKTGNDNMVYIWATFYYGLILGPIAVVFGRLGRWPKLARRLLAPMIRRLRHRAPAAATAPAADRAQWPELRARRALQPSASPPTPAPAYERCGPRADQAAPGSPCGPSRPGCPRSSTPCCATGAAACPHPSGAGTCRRAPHGTTWHPARCASAGARTRAQPVRAYRGAGVALEPALLGTSLLAVGPPGSGKTSSLVRPVVESLCLQALAGQAAVVAVGAAGARLVPDDAFDVVVKVGRPDSELRPRPLRRHHRPRRGGGMLAEAWSGTWPPRSPAATADVPPPRWRS